MILDELRKKPHLSATAIGSYIDCGFAYKIGKILKYRPEFRPDAMEFGSCIHRVLADYNVVRQDGRHLDLNDMKELFKDYWATAVKDEESVKYSNGKDYETLLNDGLLLIEQFYWKSKESVFDVVSVEVPFVFHMDEVPVPIIGVIDLIEQDSDETIIITDYKTSSRAFSSDEIDNNDQLTIYQMAARNNGLTQGEILLKLDVLIKTKQPKFEQYFTTRSKEDEARVLRKMQEVWKGITSEIFIPNSGTWKCKGCVYTETCAKLIGG
jgi:putative RecB family exonuclease